MGRGVKLYMLQRVCPMLQLSEHNIQIGHVQNALPILVHTKCKLPGGNATFMLQPSLNSYQNHPMILAVGPPVDRLARILAAAPALFVLGGHSESTHLTIIDAVQTHCGNLGTWH